MSTIGHRLAQATSILAMCMATLTGPAIGEDISTDHGKWQAGMTAVFSGFLCREPADAVQGLLAALSLSEGTSLAEFEKLEEPLHCFFSRGPVKFVGRIPHSKVFVDPDRGRFLFVAFYIGGNVTAYGWVGEPFVSDQPLRQPTGRGNGAA